MNSSTSAFPIAQPSGSGVPWQTIFWTLVPLAISSMSQPGGRICGLPNRYRTYLRCSPILCAADILSALVSILTLCACRKLCLTESVGYVLHERFNDAREGDSMGLLDDEDEHVIEGVQSLERMTWLRWLWFILGTLPPAIKLLAMGGIPWEQAWGLMFLTSWTANEGMIIFASMNQSCFTVSNSCRISWPGYELTIQSPLGRMIRLALSRVQIGLATIALVVHTVILNGVFRVVYRTWKLASTPKTNVRSMPGWQYYTTVSASYVSVISLAMIAWVLLLFFVFKRLRLRTASIFVLPLFTTYLMLVSAFLNAVTYGTSFTSSQSAEHVYVFSTTFMLAFLLLVQYFGRRFITLGNSLLITYYDEADGLTKVDIGACFSLLFFLVTILACVLWYGFIYESAGTFSPSWTGVFG